MFRPKAETSFLQRTVYIDKSNKIAGDIPTPDEIKDSKGPFIENRSSEAQITRNTRRDKLLSVIMVEKEFENHGQVENKPYTVCGIGTNLSANGLNNDNNKKKYIIGVNELNIESVKNDLQRVYYNMMLAAADNEAMGFVCPLLSTGYYSGIYKGIMMGISMDSLNEAEKEFRSNFPNSQLKIAIAKNSLNDANKLAGDLGCEINKIAVGIAGADNSGTGSLFTADTRKKIEWIKKGGTDNEGKKVFLPQEEYVRFSLGGAFNDQKNYNVINEIKYINDNEISLKNIKLDI